MTTTYQKGISAELRAQIFLTRRRYILLLRRYKTRYGEIDLIAEKDQTLHFVEVKERPCLASARCAISTKQVRRIEQAARCFLGEHPEYERQGYNFQFDAIFVCQNYIHHLENAWFFGEQIFQ